MTNSVTITGGVLIAGYVGVLLSYIVFYFVTAWKLWRHRGVRKPFLPVHIIMEKSFDEDIDYSLECSSISQVSSETARGLVSLGILSSCTGLVLLFLTVASGMTFMSVPSEYSTSMVMNSVSYASLLLVGMFPTAVPTNSEGKKRRNFNDLMCLTLPDWFTMIFHISGAFSFLFLGCISNIWYTSQQPDLHVFFVLFIVQFLYNIFFVVTQGISMCTSSTWNSLWIFIEAVCFSTTAVLYSAYQLYLYFELYV
jgi:hypothetical protein